MTSQTYRRIEIAFWDFAIRIMSENRTFRSLIQTASRLFYHPDFKKELRRFSSILAASAAAGLMCGLMLHAITVYLH